MCFQLLLANPVYSDWGYSERRIMEEDKRVLGHEFTPRSMPKTLIEQHPRFSIPKETKCWLAHKVDNRTFGDLYWIETYAAYDLGFTVCTGHRSGWRYFQKGEWCLKVWEDSVKCQFSNDNAKTKRKPKAAKR